MNCTKVVDREKKKKYTDEKKRRNAERRVKKKKERERKTCRWARNVDNTKCKSFRWVKRNTERYAKGREKLIYEAKNFFFYIYIFFNLIFFSPLTHFFWYFRQNKEEQEGNVAKRVVDKDVGVDSIL